MRHRHTFFGCVLALLHNGALLMEYEDNVHTDQFINDVVTVQELLHLNDSGTPPVIGWQHSDVEVFDHAASSAPISRIVGGKDADYKKHPYQLQLAINGNLQCGAAIISKWWAISAAHCVVDQNEKTLPEDAITVRAGATYLDTGGRVHSVSKVIVHPRYDADNQDYDVTLLKVRTPFQFGSQVQKIALPSQNQKIVEGEKALVSGWGYLEDDGDELSDSLQYVMIPIVSQKKCASHYRKHEITITERMICAGFPRGRKDSCQGDSGGPMAINEKLVGIVSWGMGCAVPKYPGVYTRLPKFRYWIKQHTGV